MLVRGEVSGLTLAPGGRGLRNVRGTRCSTPTCAARSAVSSAESLSSRTRLNNSMVSSSRGHPALRWADCDLLRESLRLLHDRTQATWSLADPFAHGSLSRPLDRRHARRSDSSRRRAGLALHRAAEAGRVGARRSTPRARSTSPRNFTTASAAPRSKRQRRHRRRRRCRLSAARRELQEELGITAERVDRPGRVRSVHLGRRFADAIVSGPLA